MMPKSDDPFLHKLIDRLHDTPLQRKFRRMAPFPVGAVFLPWPGMTEDEARQTLRKMKELGFTCLKQTMGSAEWPAQKILHLAMDEGIIPFWYGEGGWEDITPQLLKKLGLPQRMNIDEAMTHPKMIEYQTQVIRRRIDRADAAPTLADGGDKSKKKLDISWVPGVVGAVKGHELAAETLPFFVEWLQKLYGTVDALREAWNYRHVGLNDPGIGKWQSWDDVLATLKEGLPMRDYRRVRDILRFRADMYLKQHIHARVARQQQIDPEEPMRAGGEMGLFLPFASRGTDMEGIAEAMAQGGSFYPSVHLTWHFEEVDFEVTRPVYMQAQLAVDWSKGIWSATWESTGGPNYFSGGKAPFVEEARNKTPGHTVSAGTQTQLMLSWLAAGFRGFGLWTYTMRTAGWEAGEFALTDRNRNVTPRAIRAGAIGRAARSLRRELWQAHKEPLVGVLVDFENEAMWAAMSVTGREKYKSEGVRARVGASRALINANVPWEYVTPLNLKRGLAGRYKVIHLPAFISIGSELLAMLSDFVKAGGRLVIDMPGAYYDEYGRIFRTDEGSDFEKLFGAVLHEFAYNNNERWRIGDLEPEGFTCVLTPTRAKVLHRFANGLPAVTQSALGKGKAVIVAAQASMGCLRPGKAVLEKFLVEQVLGGYESPYACDGALVYRLAAPQADHYFLMNDGEAKTVWLDTKRQRYRGATDPVSGESLALGGPIALEAYSGRWLRLVK
jgi:beta-galactosidase